MANTWIITSNTQISTLVETGRLVGGAVTVVALGDGAGFAGVDRVIALPIPDAAPLEALAPAVVAAVAAAPGDLILAPNRSAERVLAGALAATLDAPVLTHVKEVADDGITVARFGGITRETTRVASTAIVIMDGGQAVEGSAVAPESAAVEVGPATIVAEQTAEVKAVTIGAAKSVVGVGRGFKAEGDLRLARDLAAALGAEVACSRPLAVGVDWLPKEVYLGILGSDHQAQHLRGCGHLRATPAHDGRAGRRHHRRLIVIGGGVAGCVSALKLAEAGRSVVLIERGETRTTSPAASSTAGSWSRPCPASSSRLRWNGGSRATRSASSTPPRT